MSRLKTYKAGKLLIFAQDNENCFEIGCSIIRTGGGLLQQAAEKTQLSRCRSSRPDTRKAVDGKRHIAGTQYSQFFLPFLKRVSCFLSSPQQTSFFPDRLQLPSCNNLASDNTAK
jgi:hypothetical protein